MKITARLYLPRRATEDVDASIDDEGQLIIDGSVWHGCYDILRVKAGDDAILRVDR